MKNCFNYPRPKHNPVQEPSDLRPMSVTPILSILVEKLVVKDFLMHKVSNVDLYDQYGFKPSDSTLVGLVDITQTIPVLLETNKYKHYSNHRFKHLLLDVRNSSH